MFLIVNIIYVCAISWKYKLNNYLVKIYNKTILISDLFLNSLKLIVTDTHPFRGISFLFDLLLFFLFPLVMCNKLKNRIMVKFITINPNIVIYYYEVYNQQITKVLLFFIQFTNTAYFIIEVPFESVLGNKIEFSSHLVKKLWVTIFFLISSPLPVRWIGEGFEINRIWVGISEAIRTKKKIIKNKLLHNNLATIRTSFSVFALSFIRSYSTLVTKNKQSLIKNDIIKDNHNNKISLKFKQWFAGITDGDGYIYVNKKGYVGFEMTLPAVDVKVLRILQNKFGGRVHARSGLNAVRYRTQNKETVTKIIHCLNGFIINNIRQVQLHKACLALNISIKDPLIPDIDSAYLSGLLDSDGTINFYEHKYNNTFRYQLTISIANKSRSNIDFLLNVIGGNIYFDKSQNGCYFWKANSKLLHLKLYNYFLKFPPKTIKAHRTYLIKEFQELNDLKAYRDTDILSINFKKWLKFLKKWNNQN